MSPWCVGAGVGAAPVLELTLVNIYTAVAVNMKLVARSAGTQEGALRVGAHLLTRPVLHHTLINVCAVVSVLG